MSLSSLPVPTSAATATTTASPACPACLHVLDGHDAIGRRFCRATLDSALTRGCICR